jgi:type I restriction enzyme S subunit
MEVKPGYKQTEVGVIPEEWEVKTLGHICSFENGDRSSNYPSPGSFRLSGIPFINAGHVADGQISTNEMNYITQEAYDRLGGGKVKAGDILFCLRGSLGKFGLVSSSFGHGAIASSLVIVRPKDALVSREYLCCYFGSALCTQMIETWAGGAAQPNLGAKELARFSIQRPPLPEQRAIAAALSDVDGLLGGLDRLIAKKRDLKQAAMQQLLIGQTRLPGFHGEWEVKRLGDLFNFSGGYSASRDQLSTEGHCYLHYGDIHGSTKTCIDADADFQNIPKLDIPLKRVSSASLLDDGDVVFVDASEDDAGTSKHVVVVNKSKKPFISGLHTIVAKSKTDELAHEFRRYCFQTPAIRQQFLFYSVGTKVSGISKSNIPKLTLSFPSVPEQTAIATVLSEMDGELAVLEQRREKTHALKQAMMQELLTGRTRLA